MLHNSSTTIDQDEIERFSRIAEEWWDENGKFKPLHQMNPLRVAYIRERAASHFGKTTKTTACLSGLSVLDIGCGGGLLCEPLCRLGANVTGIDAAQKNIAVASLHAKNMGLDIHYQCAAAEQLNGQYDIICALEIVEHVADVPAFLQAITTLLKPGGLLFMSTLNRSLKAYGMAILGAEYVLRWLPRGTHDWKKFLKPSELCEGLRKTGLSIEHMTGMVYNPLTRNWSLNERDTDVNYLLTARKQG